jgi:hypothetical protein
MGVPTDVTVVSGTNQIGVLNTAYPKPLVVLVRDADGVPQAGITIAIEVPPSGASVTLPATANTDANGYISLVATANNTAGIFNVNFTYFGATSGIFLLRNGAYANVEETRTPTSAGIGSAGGTGGAWTNTTAVSGGAGEASYIKTTAAAIPKILWGRVFGFKLPVGAIITGYRFACQARATTPTDSVFKPRLSAGPAQIWQGTGSFGLTINMDPKSYGGISDLWGTAFTVAEVNDSLFTIGVIAESPLANSFYTNNWSVRVYYNTLGALPQSVESAPLLFCEA